MFFFVDWPPGYRGLGYKLPVTQGAYPGPPSNLDDQLGGQTSLANFGCQISGRADGAACSEDLYSWLNDDAETLIV